MPEWKQRVKRRTIHARAAHKVERKRTWVYSKQAWLAITAAGQASRSVNKVLGLAEHPRLGKYLKALLAAEADLERARLAVSELEPSQQMEANRLTRRLDRAEEKLSDTWQRRVFRWSRGGKAQIVVHGIRADVGAASPQALGSLVSHLGDLILLCHMLSPAPSPSPPVIVRLSTASPVDWVSVGAGGAEASSKVAQTIETVALLGPKRKAAKADAEVAVATVEARTIEAAASARHKMAEARLTEEHSKQEALNTLRAMYELGKALGADDVSALVREQLREILGLTRPADEPLLLAATKRVTQVAETADSVEVATVVETYPETED